MVFKKWMCLCDEKIFRPGKICQIIAYHDELQTEIYSNDIKDLAKYSKMICDASLEAGRLMNVSVPTPADCKAGSHWADCH
jgi:hypothetical protein